MGIFFEQCEYVNRDCIQREIVYDGQRIYIPANYTASGQLIPDVHTFAPKIVAPYAMNQNVVMGSEDAVDPSEFDSYVVPKILVKKGKKAGQLKWDIGFKSSVKNTAKTRVDLATYLDDESLKVLDGRGGFRPSEASLAEGRTGIATITIDAE